MRAGGRALALFILLAGLVLAACRSPQPPPVPTLVPPTAAPTATPVSPTIPVPASTVPASTSVASPAPASASGQPPAGWERESNAQLSIALPPGWRSIDLAGSDAQALYDGLKQNVPLLAGIVGGPESLQAAVFWAFGPQASGAEADVFVDNLNIRRSPLGARRIDDLAPVIDRLLPEYENMGLKVTSTDPALRVNGLTAARITYTLTMQTAEGKPLEIRGRQYLVASDTDLWILSFSTTPEREGNVAADFEASAHSFRPE